MRPDLIKNDISRFYLPIILCLAALLLLWHRGSYDIHEWDEARNGVNAFDMYFNHDYLNLYFGGEPDTISSKPPMLIWLIALSYKLFGFNEFALRFPSLIATMLYFIVLYKLISFYEDSLKAFLTCLLLITCRAIIGWHVGLTGDFDALLIFFMMLSVYSYVQFLERGRTSGLYLAALYTGLAFFAKGTPGLLFLPGLLVYTLLRGKLKLTLKNKHTYLALTVLCFVIGFWVYLAITNSAYPEDTYYGSSNSIETMLIHETFNRITDGEFSDYAWRDYFFFFHNIEVRMNLWHFIFYLTVLLGFYKLYVNKNRLINYLNAPANKFTVAGICISMPIVLLVNFSECAHSWYLAPIWGFAAFITVRGMLYMQQKWSLAAFIWIFIFAFNFVKHFMFIDNKSTEMHRVMRKENPFFKTTEQVVLMNPLKDHLLLYLYWMDMDFIRYDETGNKTTLIGQKAIAYRNDIQQKKVNAEVVDCFDEYCLIKLK